MFLELTVTGVLLMFYYRPTLEHAYNDSSCCETWPRWHLRELHRWGAHAMVITIWLHMYRVFLTGSYKPRGNSTGVSASCSWSSRCCSASPLPLAWDQLAIWAITVGSNMAARRLC